MSTIAEVTPAQRMTRARLFVGLEQADMAELLGKSRNTISAWERGVNDPPLSAVAKWARITGRSIDWIVWGDDETPTASAMGVSGSRLRESNPRPIHYMAQGSSGSEAFWTPGRALSIAELWRQLDVDTVSTFPEAVQ